MSQILYGLMTVSKMGMNFQTVYIVNYAEAKEGLKLGLRRSRRKSYVNCAISFIVGAAILTWGVVADNWLGYVLASVPLFTAIYPLLGWERILQKFAKQHEDAQARMEDRICTFTDDGMRVKSSTEDTSYKWEAFSGFGEGEKVIMLRMPTDSTMILPKSMFSEGQLQQLVSVLDRKVERES